LCAPTGSGKTVMFSAMVAAALAEGKRALILVHRRELVDQAVDKLRALGIEPGVILAGVKPQPERAVQVASIQTLGACREKRRCRELPPADYVIVDECHHAVSATWRRLIDAYPDAIVIGATATPWRTDKRGLADLFETHVVAATVAELIANGDLCEYDVRAYNAPDLHEVPIVAGEFHQGQLALACNTAVIVGGIVSEYLTYGRGRRGLLFAVSVENSLALVAELEAHGVRAEHVDGSTPKPERAAILRRLAAGETHVVSNVGCFTEGFDCPGIEICILARPTMSLSLHLQMVGRGLRPAPGKARALLVDHGGNFLRHGLPDDERDYSLTATPQRVAELHRCPLCLAVFHHINDDGSCPKCREVIAPPREVREEQARREKERVEGELLDKEQIRRRREEDKQRQALELKRSLAEAFRADSPQKAYSLLMAIAAKRGYQPKWAAVQYMRRFKRWPSFAPKVA
jgi:superfamily II DNA or RNA helicase